MDDIQRRLHDAKLGAAVENAAAKLPDGYTVTIAVMRNSGDVVLCDPDGEECEFPSNHESIAESINDAVEFAIQSAFWDRQAEESSS